MSGARNMGIKTIRSQYSEHGNIKTFKNVNDQQYFLTYFIGESE